MKKKIILLLFISILSVYFGYKYFGKKKTLNSNQEIVNFIINTRFSNKTLEDKIKSYSIKWSIPLLKELKEEVLIEEPINEPTIYLYNSHPKEEYQRENIGNYTLNPTVTMNNYILKDLFEKEGINTYVEEESVSDILNNNNWNYASSYKASRILLEKRKQEYNSLTYFIDIHRDSLTKDKTTVVIDDKEYAKVLFIVGLENNNYKYNLEFTEKIVNKLDEKYPNLCKGIYKKQGAGVNGVYNQDFSPKTILIEIGGYENNTTEVLNTCLAFKEVFMEVINEETN